jgi:hypothetical protein
LSGQAGGGRGAGGGVGAGDKGEFEQAGTGKIGAIVKYMALVGKGRALGIETVGDGKECRDDDSNEIAHFHICFLYL